MIRLVAVLAVFAVALLAAYFFISVMDYVQVKMTGASNSVAAAVGYGGNVSVPKGYNLRVSGGAFSVYGTARTSTALNITDATCVVVANATWQWHGCGPATVPIAPGYYSISVVRYPPLRRDFTDVLMPITPLAVIAVLTLVVLLIYTRWR
jgi:hypothetical protein